MQTVHKFTDLEFVKSNQGQIASTWTPERTNIYLFDTQKGREYAIALIELIRLTQNPTLLGKVMQDIITQGVFEAVEIGFMQQLAETAAG